MKHIPGARVAGNDESLNGERIPRLLRNARYFKEEEMGKVQRFGSVIGVRPEKLEYYKQLHAAPWPEINAMIKACNIRNYSIYYKDGLLFSYYEYVGDDYEADMAKMADDPKTQEWWAECKPCQQPLETRAPGEWWADMPEVYHLD